MKDRTVVVTGGTGALGCGVVAHLLDVGARVHVVDRSTSGCEFEGHDRATVHYGCSVLDEDTVVQLYAGIDDLWGSVHLAGGFRMGPFEDIQTADMRFLMDLNYMSVFMCTREAVRAMKGTGGRIVNVVARPALTPTGGMVAYAASKAAVASLTQCVAEEVKHDGILVNAIAPSLFDTPANRAAMPDADHDAWPKTNELARAIEWLLSPENTLTSGALVPVYGRQ